jgi:positive regulator of sigma E activity
MPPQTVLISYAFLLIFQNLHVFEELGMEAYKIKIINSKRKYLRAASLIMCFYIVSYLFIVLELVLGTWLGIICSIIAIGNFLIHTIGYIKIRNYRGTIASGVFSSLPLGILGIINLITLIQII